MSKHGCRREKKASTSHISKAELQRVITWLTVWRGVNLWQNDTIGVVSLRGLSGEESELSDTQEQRKSDFLTPCDQDVIYLTPRLEI